MQGGGGKLKQGLKSISISPAITTTPALDSLFPIYWEDLTDEQKQSGVNINLTTTTPFSSGDEFTFTIAPTSEWYAAADDFGEKGQPITKEAAAPNNEMFGVNSIALTNKDESNPQFFMVNVEVTYENGED